MRDLSYRFLVIEDNPGDVRLIREMLSDDPDGAFSLDSADRLSNGLAMIAGEVPDLVICDLNLPDSRGLETVKRLIREAGSLPIVVLTAINDKSLAMDAVQEGAQDYLVKGEIQGRLLWRTILHAIERKRIEETLRRSEQRLKEAQTLGKLGSWEFDLASQKIEWSDEVFRLYERDRALGPPSVEEEAQYYSSEDARILHDLSEKAVQEDKDQYHDVRLLLPGGRQSYLTTSMHAVKNRSGQAVKIFGTIQDITDRKLRERLHTALYHIASAAFSAADLDGLYQEIFRILSDLMPIDIFGVSLYDHQAGIFLFPFCRNKEGTHRESRPWNNELVEQVFQTGFALEADPEKIRRMSRTGGIESLDALPSKWLGVPLKTNGGTIGVMTVETFAEPAMSTETDLRLLSFISDQIAMAIERKRTDEALKVSLAEKDTLLKEIHHRVKNNMQIICSLLRLQADNVHDPQVNKILKECQIRIRSMAMIHERLYRAKELSRIDAVDYVASLVDHLFSTYRTQSDHIRLQLAVENLYLNIETANPFALLLNELVSNAVLHAFPNRREGVIKVSLSMDEKNILRLSVKDNGIGFPEEIDFRNTESMGMEIVMTLVRQLEATIDLVRKDGSEFIITFEELAYKARLSPGNESGG